MYYNKVEICGVNTAKLPTLTSKEKKELLKQTKQGDPAAREKLIDGNLRLVLSIIQRFTNRGEDIDDLFQIGCIGLIKAVDNFNTDLDVKFSTYAVPMIIGELRRYLRDNNIIRVSRSIRDLAYKALQAREELSKRNQNEISIDEIVKYLNDNGVRSGKGKPITKTSATSMLSNVKYKGQYKYRDIIIDGGVPRIVSDALFNKVQERLKKNKYSRSRFKAKIEYFLSTKLICGYCGEFMIGESGTSRQKIKYNYYKCTGVKRHKGCHKKTVRKADIEEIVLTDVMDKMFKEDLINDIADSVMRLQEKENTTIPLMQKQLAGIHQSINNLVKAMEMGIVSRETKQRFEELEAQRTELETDIIKQEIQEEIITREQVVEWLKEMKRLDLSLYDSKRKLVDTFVNSVYLYDDKVVIIFNCREGASTLALPLDDTSACMRIGEPN